MTASGADRYRNYGALMQRYEQGQRLRKAVRVFVLFAIILALVMLLLILARWETNQSAINNKTTHLFFSTEKQVLKPTHWWVFFCA